jgi:hypothetical protein
MGSCVVSRSPIQLRVEDSVAQRLAGLSQGRALRIDYWASRRCGVTIGDLRVGFGAPPVTREYAELEPVGDIRVIAERSLLEILAAGAVLRFGRPEFARHLALMIDEPERWLDFLSCHPGNRR